MEEQLGGHMSRANPEGIQGRGHNTGPKFSPRSRTSLLTAATWRLGPGDLTPGGAEKGGEGALPKLAWVCN